MEENKIKAQFFAMYLGQKFIVKDRLERKDRGIHILEDFTLDAVNIGGSIFDDSIEMDIVVDACTLLLRDISQLTDDECILIAGLQSSILKECAWDKISVTRNLKEYVTVWGFKGEDHIHIAINEYSFYQPSVDYARSIGVLLPFTYLNSDNQPITLQPAEIIAKGWAVIKTEE